jgi:hypothetical protein
MPTMKIGVFADGVAGATGPGGKSISASNRRRVSSREYDKVGRFARHICSSAAHAPS